jgi:hypothetical protein
LLGQIDLRFPYNSFRSQVDAAKQPRCTLVKPVKIVDSADGVPKVIACAADAMKSLALSTSILSRASSSPATPAKSA